MIELQVGGAVRASALYLARAADGALLEALEDGAIAYVLAPRQMGKTSLRFRALAHLVDRGARCASVDLSALGLELEDPEAFYLAFVSELAAELGLDDPDEHFEARSGRPPVARLGSWLRDVALPAGPGDLVIFVDEVDTLVRRPLLAAELLARLRASWERRPEEGPRLGLCLLGVAAPWQLVVDPATTPFNVGREIALEDFTRDELAPLADAIEGDAAAVLDAVYAETAGHPYMTARLLEALPRPARIEDVAPAVRRLWLDADGDVTLTASERALVAGPAELLDLYGAALREGSVRAPHPDLAREALLTGMLARGPEGGLVPRNAIYRRVFDAEWVERRTRQRPFGEAVRRWVDGGRRDADGLRGIALAEMQAWSAEATLTADEQALLVQSVEAARREEVAATRARANRRNQRVLWGAVAVLSVALAGVGVALRAEQRASARASALAEASRAELLLAAPKRERMALEAATRAIAFRDDDGAPLPEARHALAAALDATASEVRPGVGAPLVAVGCAPDSRRAAARTADGRVLAWGLGEAGPPTTLDEAPEWLPAPTRLPRGEVHARSLAADVRADTEGESGDITLARASDGAPLGRLSGLQSEAMTALRFDPRGATLLSVCDDDTAVLWSVSSLRALRRFGAIPTTPRDGAICGQGSRALLAGDDGALRIWRLHGAALESHLAPDGSAVTWAEWDRDGGLWIASARGAVYERAASARRFAPRLDGLGGHAWAVLGPEGVVVASDESGGTRLLDHGRVTSLDGWARRRERAITPDGQRVILMRGADVALVDVATGHDLHVFSGHAARLETAGLSPDGRSIASGDVEGGLRVWDVDGRALRWSTTHAPGPIYSAVWSPDGRWIVTHGRVDEVVVWDASSGDRVATFEGHRGTTNLARFSDDGARVVTAGYADNTAQVWDPASGRAIAVLEGHRARVRVADFDPSGELVATAGDDSTVRLWDARTGAALATFGGLDGPVRHLRIAPRGDRVLTVCDDGWLRVYPTDWRAMLRSARRMLEDPG